MREWYLVCCKRGKIRRAEESFLMHGIRAFCPVIKSEKVRNDKKKGVRIKLEPMFPPYLFVEFDPLETSISKINSIPGVNRIVRFGNVIKPVPNDVVSKLMFQSCLRVKKVENENTMTEELIERRLVNVLEIHNPIERSCELISFLYELISYL